MLPEQDRKNIALIGIPVEEGAGRQGCRMGPDALRIAGIHKALEDLGHNVTDLGDIISEKVEIEIKGRANSAPQVVGWTNSLFNIADKTLSSNLIPVYLGGDHSLSMGSLSAALTYAETCNKPLHVLWLDAHADYNTPETSPTGNMHGMSTAYCCGEFDLGIREHNFPKLKHQNLHIFGARSIDNQEKERLAKRGVDICDMRAIDEFGTAPLIRRILDQVESEHAMLHVSLDVDFLDPKIAPGVGTTVPGGATFREAHLVMEMVSESNLMTSLDLVELNPFLDERGKSARLMVELAASIFGRKVFDRHTEAA